MMAHDFAKIAENLSLATTREPDNLNMKNRWAEIQLSAKQYTKDIYISAPVVVKC